MESRRDKYTGSKVIKNKDLVIDVNFDSFDFLIISILHSLL